MVFSNKSEMCSRDPIYSLYPCHYHVVVGCDIACSPALKDPEGFYGPKKGMSVSLPDELKDIVSCSNPKCISNNEPMHTRFHVVDEGHTLLRCHYCERIIPRDEAVLK